MAILCYFQLKEVPNIGYRKSMHQYWKDYGLFELKEEHLACLVRSILKPGKLSKLEIEGLKRQFKQIYVTSVKAKARELDREEERSL